MTQMDQSESRKKNLHNKPEPNLKEHPKQNNHTRKYSSTLFIHIYPKYTRGRLSDLLSTRLILIIQKMEQKPERRFVCSPLSNMSSIHPT